MRNAGMEHRSGCSVSAFFVFIVLSNSRSVLLLLKTKNSGGIHHDGRTETTDYCSAPRRSRVWEDSSDTRYFYQYSEIFLQTAQPGYQEDNISL